MRVRISYSDQNESLRLSFPVSGTVGETELRAAKGEHLWRIVYLDHPLLDAMFSPLPGRRVNRRHAAKVDL
jgi:hypothetical protein